MDNDDRVYILRNIEQIHARQLPAGAEGRFEACIWIKVDGEDRKFIRQGHNVGTALLNTINAVWEAME